MASPYKVRNKPTKPSSDRSKILILLIFSSLVLSGFLYATLIHEPEQGATVQKASRFPDIYAKNLGKTPSYFKNKYPDLFLTHDRFGNSVAHFPFDDAKYSIWFITENKQERAFRIKIDKTYKNLSEKEITDHFAKLYGRTVDVQCDGKTSSSTQHCRYKWWVRNAVTLDLYSCFAQNKPVTLSAVTTDTYLAGKYHGKTKGFQQRE